MGSIILEEGSGRRQSGCVCAGVVQLCPLGAGVTRRRGCSLVHNSAVCFWSSLVFPAQPFAHIMQSCSLRLPFAFSSGI